MPRGIPEARACTIDSSTTKLSPMILEHAVLQVRDDATDEFENAFREASSIISAMRGFVSLRLERCLESRNRYLLLVEWERLEDHTVGFRHSAEYEQWRQLLHHFYEPFPDVDHYELVLTG